MADIFISYSKADRDKVVMLVAYLESEGWTVWWDTNLAVGDAYRDQIMKQLAVARAVIVLWTQNSIKSDFVRAEAGQAKAQGKLIPVKEAEVAYGDIPLPFGEMHTEELSKRELIRAAVVSLLARPQVQQSGLWVATRSLRYEALTWVGIVGGAITLFVNLRAALDLAGWASWLVTHWRELTETLWIWAFNWIGIQFPKEWTLVLTFCAFCLVTSWGGRRLARPGSNLGTFRVTWIGVHWVTMVYLFLTIFPIMLWILSKATGIVMLGGILPVPATGFLLIGIPMVLFPIVYLGFIYSHQIGYLVVFVLMYAFSCMIFFSGHLYLFYIGQGWQRPIEQVDADLGFVLILLALYFLPFAMLSICPLHAIAKRFTFIVIGISVLIVLNQLSLYAPDIRVLLKLAGSVAWSGTHRPRCQRWGHPCSPARDSATRHRGRRTATPLIANQCQVAGFTLPLGSQNDDAGTKQRR